MSRIELARSSKGLIQRVEGMLRATLPRQARVTAVEGNSVWVRFLGEESTDPEAKFVSTVAGVPVATMGWVITLGGKKGLFVATNVWQPVPIDLWAGGSVNTTSLSTPVLLIDESVTLPVGRWEFRLHFTAAAWRSVTTGQRRMHCIIDGSDTTLTNSVAPVPLNQAFRIHYVANRIINVTEERDVPIQMGVSGGDTAGTTTMAYGTITGSLIRVGGPT